MNFQPVVSAMFFLYFLRLFIELLSLPEGSNDVGEDGNKLSNGRNLMFVGNIHIKYLSFDACQQYSDIIIIVDLLRSVDLQVVDDTIRFDYHVAQEEHIQCPGHINFALHVLVMLLWQEAHHD